jgi:DNA-binding NtrC family response regulator
MENNDLIKTGIAGLDALLSTILVVDDEPALRGMAGTILKYSGYCVVTANNGREAVDTFRQNPSEIAVILLDMTMPVMGGADAFRLIREIQPGVPIIVSTGYSETFAREELGFDVVAEFLQKPYNAARLVESIREALQHDAQAVDRRTSHDLARRTHVDGARVRN